MLEYQEDTGKEWRRQRRLRTVFGGDDIAVGQVWASHKKRVHVDYLSSTGDVYFSWNGGAKSLPIMQFRAKYIK